MNASALQPSVPRPATRLAYLDSLRAAAIAMVIVHHAALPYGPAGANAWPLTDARHAAVLGPFFAVNSGFGMALIFLLSGCVVPDSFDRHGAAVFVWTRLRRLGVPLVVFSMVMLVPGIVFQFVRDGRELASFPGYLFHTLFSEQHLGHLWYLAVLLVFVLVYAGCRLAAPGKARATQPPGTLATLGLLAALAGSSFALRIWFPIDRWVAVLGIVPLEPAHLPQYLCFFALGTVGRRRGWLEAMSPRRGMAFLVVGIAAAAVCYLRPLWAGGGATLAALRWAAWESLICTGMCVGLLMLFRDRCATPGRLARWAAPQAYATYILHIPIVLVLQSAIAHAAWPLAGKLCFVAGLAVPLSFLAAAGARQWRVLRAIL
jgi:peptidoglycan/LPS O-acetylase OafA/YrhL